MVDITVIMPLYNAEKYLEESLESVLAQSFQNFELICVNDASEDNTLNILQKYGAADKRIKILSNVNRMGAAASRNKAIEKAEGVYLIFLDGDDVFHEDMLQVAYETAVKHNADIVEYQYKLVSSEDIQTKANIIHSESYRKKFCLETFKISDLEPYEFMNCHTAPWGKIYRREFIEKEQLRFQDLSCCNDVYFVNMALLLAQRIIFADDSRVMVYVRQHNAPSRISNDRDPMNAYLANRKVLETLVKKGKMTEVYQQLYYRVYCGLVETLKNTKSEKRAKDFYVFLQDEGIEELRALEGEYYKLLDIDMQNKYEKFEKLNFELEWYKEEGEFSSYLEGNTENIKQLFSEWEKEGKKIGIWGIGRNGKSFLKYCRQIDLNIDVVMDADEEKWGKSFFDFPKVMDPQNGIHLVQVLILTSSNLVEDISKKIQQEGLNVQICDINLYLGR